MLCGKRAEIVTEICIIIINTVSAVLKTDYRQLSKALNKLQIVCCFQVPDNIHCVTNMKKKIAVKYLLKPCSLASLILVPLVYSFYSLLKKSTLGKMNPSSS